MDRPTLGRNDPCPCGSRKKYKACCWDKDRAKSLEQPAPQSPAAPAEDSKAKPDKPQGQGWHQLIKDRHPGRKR